MKIFNRISALLMAVMVLLGLTVSVAAEDTSVIYEGGAEEFVFIPDSTDLFDNFKNVMPGDERRQTIRIKNTSGSSDYVKIYMKAAPDKNLEFLQQMGMTVYKGGTDGEVLYSGTDTVLTDPVLLGSFDRGEEAELTVVLTVPLTMGNKYAHETGEIDWTFLVEEHNYSSGGGSGAPDRVTLQAEKQLNGGDPGDARFTFVLEENGREIARAHNRGSEILFDTISYDKKGSHVYTLREIDEGAEGITYDERIYMIQVDVTMRNGDYRAKVTYPDGEPVFYNEAETVVVPPPVDPMDPVEPVDPGTPDQPDSPKTGDEANIWLWVAVFSAALAMLVVLLCKRKKERS